MKQATQSRRTRSPKKFKRVLLSHGLIRLFTNPDTFAKRCVISALASTIFRKVEIHLPMYLDGTMLNCFLARGESEAVNDLATISGYSKKVYVTNADLAQVASLGEPAKPTAVSFPLTQSYMRALDFVQAKRVKAIIIAGKNKSKYPVGSAISWRELRERTIGANDATKQTGRSVPKRKNAGNGSGPKG